MARHSHLHPQSGGRIILVRLGIGALIVLSGYLLFEFGRIQADYNVVDAARERAGFENQIAGLEERITDLKQEVAMHETHRDIDREAYRKVEADLVALEAKIQEQTDAIAFYRGIVSPEDGNSGLRVQDLKLSRGRDENAYNLRLVLVQSLKHDRKVSGDVLLTLTGKQDGADASYPYAELLPGDARSDWAFSFRYFQDFDREIVLPDGFVPESINIEVRSKTRSISSIEESYSWTPSLG